VAAVDEGLGRVEIEMLGACGGCPLSQLDFSYAIESLIRREVPEVREILAV
jgi:Fe-S cluster biogenesis protein NfuA